MNPLRSEGFTDSCRPVSENLSGVKGIYYKEPGIFKLKISADGQIIDYQAVNTVAMQRFEKRIPGMDLNSRKFPDMPKSPNVDFKLEFRGIAYKLTPYSETEQSGK